MIIIHTKDLQTISDVDLLSKYPQYDNISWIDLIDVSDQEEFKLEQALGINIPTFKETKNILIANRLYEENNAIYMTITLYLKKNDINKLKLHTITFIIKDKLLVTIRDKQIDLFDKVIASTGAKFSFIKNPCFEIILILLEKLINSTAAFLEELGHVLDNESEQIIKNGNRNKINYRDIIKNITNTGNEISKTRESLISFIRMLDFILHAEQVHYPQDFTTHIKIFLKNLNVLVDHTGFLSSKINFLLDATLGLVNIEQNNIIKIFSVVSVIFMPPTLIASIYGMNFEIIPEFKWFFGYPLALIMMLVSSWLPYKYFKKKKWF